MKRLSMFLLLCLLTVMFAAVGEAGDLQTYIVSNSTAARAKTQVAVTTIIPGKHVILGYRITPFGASCVDPYVELHDAATTATQTTTTGGTMFDLIEADTGPLRSDGDWYPKGKPLALGLSVNLGGYTAATIFYEELVR